MCLQSCIIFRSVIRKVGHSIRLNCQLETFRGSQKLKTRPGKWTSDIQDRPSMYPSGHEGSCSLSRTVCSPAQTKTNVGGSLSRPNFGRESEPRPDIQVRPSSTFGSGKWKSNIHFWYTINHLSPISLEYIVSSTSFLHQNTRIVKRYGILWGFC